MRIILADDHYLVREGTRRLLETVTEVEVVASVGTSTELRDAVDRLRPDAAIVDIRMPPGGGTEGITAAHAIRASHASTGIVILSQYADAAYAMQLFAHGTDGLAYLLKDRVTDVDDLVAALRAVADGGSVIDPRIVDSLITMREQRESSPIGSLTERELEVLREMARGSSNAAIADALGVSQSSVEKHISTVFGKLGLDPGEEAINRRVMAVLTLLRGEPRAERDGPAR